MGDVSKFLTSTLAWALTVEDGEAAAHLVAAILNKHANSTYRRSMIASN
jgi:hypothetical protein